MTARPRVTRAGAVTAPAQLVSLRAAARHLGVSVEAIRRAIKAERLSAALRVDSKGRPRLDLPSAEREWRANISDHQLRGRPWLADPPAATPGGPVPPVPRADGEQSPPANGGDALAIPVGRFSVIPDGDLVLLAVFEDAAAEPDLDNTAVFPMEPRTAKEVALALLKAAGAKVRFAAGA